MKTNFSFKHLLLLFMLTCISFAYADKLNFTFLRSENVGVIGFDQPQRGYTATTASGGSITTTTGAGSSNGSSYIVTVNTSIKKGSSLIAESFNSSLGNDTSHMIDVGGPDHTAEMLDFEVPGILSIEGKVLTRNLYLAHTNSKYKNSPKDWWIGSPDGQIYTTASGSRKMTLTTEDGTQQYCLNQNNTNYNVIVSYGACNESTPLAYDWSNLKYPQIIFNFASCDKCVSKVSDVRFEYTGVHDATHNNFDYLRNVENEPTHYDKNNEPEYVGVKVYSKLDSDSATADSFNKIFGNTNSSFFGTAEDYPATLPTQLSFWVQGNLYIESSLASTNFTLGFEQGFDSKWWAASSVESHYFGEIELKSENGMIYCLTQCKNHADEINVYKQSCSNIN